MLKLLILTLFCFPVFAQVGSNTPLDVAADQLDVTFQDKQAIFKGNVVVIRGNMKVESDTLTLQQTANNALEKMTARGNVKLTRGNDIATGSTAVFTPATNILVLSGNVQLTRAGNTLSGETLRYNLTEGTLKLNTTKGGGRVKAVVQPSTLKKD